MPLPGVWNVVLAPEEKLLQIHLGCFYPPLPRQPDRRSICSYSEALGLFNTETFSQLARGREQTLAPLVRAAVAPIIFTAWTMRYLYNPAPKNKTLQKGY